MNQELSNVLKIYSTQKHIDFTSRLLDSSKDTVISLFTDLLTMYINDKNSSTIREYLTVVISGYNHSEGKIGFNGFKQSSITAGKPLYCEAKPKNISTADFHNPDKKTKRKLNGGGNYTDYTWARFEKDKLENPSLLVSGFVDGKLIYIIEFPFCCENFTINFEIQLQKAFPNGREAGKYLRSCRFDYKNFILDQQTKFVFLLNKEEIKDYEQYFDRNFYKILMSKYE